MSEPVRTEVHVDGRRLRLSNLDKVMYPKTGFTKGDLIDYAARIADVLLPHLAGRPLTRVRYPDGVEAERFFEKSAPSHTPEWVPIVEVPSGRRGVVRYPIADSRATLVWLANLAALELHPLLSTAEDLSRPTAMVFDLDPGPPAHLLEAAAVACIVRERLADLGLDSFPKVSGGKGVHLYVPLNTPCTFDDTKQTAHALALLLEREHEELVVSRMAKELRRGKVLIDWSQNDDSKTTVAAYSLRAEPEPTVSTPVTWTEVEDACRADDAARLRFGPDDVLRRIDEHGDLFASVLELEQELPG